MKLKPIAHTVLHVGCIVLLLLQGHRIFELQRQERENQKKVGRMLEMFARCMGNSMPFWLIKLPNGVADVGLRSICVPLENRSCSHPPIHSDAFSNSCLSRVPHCRPT
jgi:hypothetical protein